MTEKLILTFDVIALIILMYSFRLRKSFVIVLMFIALLLTPLINFYLTGAIISRHLSFNEFRYYDDLLAIMSIFIFVLFIAVYPLGNKFINGQIIFPIFYASNVKFILMSLSLFLVIRYGTHGDNILESNGNYGQDGFISSYFEYGIIPLFLLLSTSGGSRIRIIVVLTLTLYYIYCSLLFGSRITIMSIFMLYFVRFETKIKYLFVLLFAPLLMVLLNIIALFRKYLFDFSVVEAFNFSLIDSGDGVQSNHQSDVVHSSIRLLGMIDQGVITLQDRIISALSNLAAIFIPFKYLPDIANLSMYRAEDFDVGGGGFFPVYFFVWFGYLGILISVLLIFLYLKFSSSSNLYLRALAVIFFLTSPRWVMYSPINLLKMSFVLMVFLFLIRLTFTNPKNL